MKLRKIKQKKAAIELSVSTVVIIVLAMTMLILGLVLVRNIFKFGTESVDTLSDKVRGEITNIFTEEGSKIAIRLGSDKVAKIKQGDKVGVGIGGETDPGAGAASASASSNNLKFSIEESGTTTCTGISILDLTFNNGLTQRVAFDDEDGPNGFSILFFEVEDNAPECTQKYKIHTYDTAHTYPAEIASASFRVQIVSGGIFS